MKVCTSIPVYLDIELMGGERPYRAAPPLNWVLLVSQICLVGTGGKYKHLKTFELRQEFAL